MPTKKMTMGPIVGNRHFFRSHLAKSGREEMPGVPGSAGTDVVALTPEESKPGAVETREESKVEIPRMQTLLPFVCKEGLEHHTANLSTVASVHEAATRNLSWDTDRHGWANGAC